MSSRRWPLAPGLAAAFVAFGPAVAPAVAGEGGAPVRSPGSRAVVVAAARRVMEMPVEVKVFAEDDGLARDSVAAALDDIARTMAMFSERQADSGIGRLNRGAGGDVVKIDAETLMVLKTGLAVAGSSAGGFALTTGALLKAWGFDGGARQGAVPGAEQIAAALGLVDDRKLVVDDHAMTARLPVAGMAISARGLLKGYALDRALALLRGRGYRSALVFVDGDVGAIGGRDDRPWQVGIQDPRAKGYFAVVALKDRAAATAGDYQSYFEAGGERYHDLLDPRTGRPARGIRSVTVIAGDAITADALARAAFVLGAEAGMELVQSRPGIEAVFVDSGNQVTVSDGLKAAVRVVRPPSE
ncbi:MAG: FAD:protein FMN transferase [Deltaproteobacteria bacterium]|nr:FAD:protein FMN transferase [Deltaproteobacteria bacterium]